MENGFLFRFFVCFIVVDFLMLLIFLFVFVVFFLKKSFFRFLSERRDSFWQARTSHRTSSFSVSRMLPTASFSLSSPLLMFPQWLHPHAPHLN